MAPRTISRDQELSAKPGVKKQLLEVFNDVSAGFGDQRKRSDQLLDNWDMFNCKLNEKQFYNGQSQIFLPFVHDAVMARKTRYVNQLFPVSGRFVEVTTTEEIIPQATMALLESYVRKAKLQTEVVPPMLVNGDVEGQYNLYVSWIDHTRKTVRRVSKANVQVNGVEFEELGKSDDYEDDEARLGRPDVEVLHDSDVLILPVTARGVDDAIACGGSVTICRRWSKGRIRRAIDDGDIDAEAGEMLIRSMQAMARSNREVGERIAEAAGVQDRGKSALVYETWTEVKVGQQRLLCRAYYGGEDNILGCKRNPYWCDRVPLISQPVIRMTGVVKGWAPVEAVSDLQILANDTINEGADTSHFSAMPITMTDPEKNPRSATMILGLGAIWETNPTDTQIVEFPELWQDAMQRALACQAQIFQTLGVNPSMVPSTSSNSGKQSQAEIANQQQVDVLTADDSVTSIEQNVMTPLIQWFADLDHQFRDEDVTIRVYGEVGVRAKMETVEPIQIDNRWEFRWYGVEASQNAAAMQQQIAFINVVNGLGPEKYPDYELDVAPMLVQSAENLFGPRLAPLIFKRKQVYSMDPLIENDMLENGFIVPVNVADNDQEHLAAHQGLLSAQPPGSEAVIEAHMLAIREHIAAHIKQMQEKALAAQVQQPQGGNPGVPGGSGPGVAGTPKPGAMPEGPRLMKGPAGMIHPDSMGAADPSAMPRQ